MDHEVMVPTILTKNREPDQSRRGDILCREQLAAAITCPNSCDQ